MAAAQRNSGYGRFSDADDEPAYRPPPPAAAAAGNSGRDWQEIGNADVLVPEDVDYPLGVVHFVGGQGVGVFPRSAYGALLEGLVDAGAVLVCFFRCFIFVFGLFSASIPRPLEVIMHGLLFVSPSVPRSRD